MVWFNNFFLIALEIQLYLTLFFLGVWLSLRVYGLVGALYKNWQYFNFEKQGFTWWSSFARGVYFKLVICVWGYMMVVWGACWQGGWSWPHWPFPGCQGVCGLCLGSRAQHVCALSSDVYTAGKFHWHFTCGFDFSFDFRF